MSSGTGGGTGGEAVRLDRELVDLLRCPAEGGGSLAADGDDLVCPECGRRFPVSDGVVSFLSAQELSDQDHREREMRDEESSWYDAMFEGYTNAVEVPAAVSRVGRPTGPILDAGCGTGRITEALVALGQPVVAVDYSGVCLRRMLERVKGARVLAVQSDLRAIPLAPGSMAAATCIEVYSQLRAPDRRRLLDSLARALAPGSPLSITAFNYNLLFRAWKLKGNQGARTGEHMLGGDYFYHRFTRDELSAEIGAVFEVDEVTGMRNIPARTISAALGKVGLTGAGDRFLSYMVERGHRADTALERKPALSGVTGFFWQVRARRR
ncbi:MAG: methyltransferase domain-containing protein [Actinomycetota bacterium]